MQLFNTLVALTEGEGILHEGASFGMKISMELTRTGEIEIEIGVVADFATHEMQLAASRFYPFIGEKWLSSFSKNLKVDHHWIKVPSVENLAHYWQNVLSAVLTKRLFPDIYFSTTRRVII